MADPESHPPALVTHHPAPLRGAADGRQVENPARQPRLTPGAIAADLFCLIPDRDERAPQLCAETLLTLGSTDRLRPRLGRLITPKRQLFALRSLALGENFLGGRDDGRAGDDETTPADYGASLAAGREVRSSAHLSLAHQTLQGLVDPETQRGPARCVATAALSTSRCCGTTPARPVPSSSEYTVRKVYMRGSGITLARLLADPADPAAAELGRAAVAAIRAALTGDSPLAARSATTSRGA